MGTKSEWHRNNYAFCYRKQNLNHESRTQNIEILVNTHGVLENGN